LLARHRSLDAQIRQVFFFDTPDLSLSRAGVAVRARRVQGKGDDAVKLRPVLPDQLRRSCEGPEAVASRSTRFPDGYVCSASMKSTAHADVRETLLEGRPLRKVFSKEQQAFFAECAPDGIRLDDLSVLAPIFVLKLKFTPENLQRRLVAEMWLYPDSTRILELPTKCAPAESFLAAARCEFFSRSRVWTCPVSRRQRRERRSSSFPGAEGRCEPSPALAPAE
jgi:hypothetical protein